MNKEIRSQILNLSAGILLGKATKADIEKITRLAIDNGEGEFLRRELESCGRIIFKN